MKKFLISVMCAAVSVASLFGLSACGGGKSGQAVNLVSVTAAEVGVRGDVDYFVVPEPAASVKVGAMKNLVFSGDVQKLYGGEEGYPQAVVVVKNNIAANSLIGALVSELKTSEDWLLSEEVSSSTICNAVASHLTKGMTPTFTEKNLDKSVIENCSVKFTDARNCKQKVKAFMEKINAVGQSAFGMPQDKFFSEESNFENTEHVGSVSVYAPDGAPALGLAKLMAEMPVLNGTDMNYGIVDATTIQTYVTGSEPRADICVLPVNLAVKLLGDGEKYKMLGTLTNGNLLLLSAGKPSVTKENISSLKGKTVGVVNLAQVPGLVFKTVLKDNGLEFKELI